jgi:hypothetical protein
MSLPLNRRRHDRHMSEGGYFVVAGKPARLVDWSFGGLALRMEEPADISVSEDVDIRVFDAAGGVWEGLKGHVRRIDSQGVVGVAFADDGEASVRILLRLFGNRTRANRA